MISVREVKGSRDIKKFVDFPIKLYKRCEYFVPCLYSDEKKLLSGKTSYDDVAESAFFTNFSASFSNTGSAAFSSCFS